MLNTPPLMEVSVKPKSSIMINRIFGRVAGSAADATKDRHHSNKTHQHSMHIFEFAAMIACME